MKRVLLIEPDKDMAGPFVKWLEEVEIKAVLSEGMDGAGDRLSSTRFDMMIVDIDSPGTTEGYLKACGLLKHDSRHSDIPIIILTFKKDVARIVAAIESGVDGFVFKPFETAYLMERIGTLILQQKLMREGRKIIDLNYINFLMDISAEYDKKSLFKIVEAVFNELVIAKVEKVLGAQVIVLLKKRVDEIIESDSKFTWELEFADGRFCFDKLVKTTEQVPPDKLIIGFRRYMDHFLGLVQTLTSDVLMEWKGRG